LQLVAAFLRLQAKSAEDEAVRHQLEEANRRLNAVALVHRRLYRDDNIEVIGLARYLEELVEEMRITMDPDWRRQIVLSLSPILMAADRAVTIGLVLTELVINARKYAYDGAPGLLSIQLEQHRNTLRLIVADRGKGKIQATGSGFGTRMLAALIGRLRGRTDEEDNEPGLRTVVTVPIETGR
jgi:two-component sensor histidine kinase